MKRYLLICILICLLCSGCGKLFSSTSTKLSRTLFAMDTVMNLTVYGGSESLLDETATLISNLEHRFSVTLDGSEIQTLNRTGSCVLSDETYTLLTDTLKLCESTKGVLDISIYPVLKAWGFTTGEYQIPSAAKLSSLLESVDYSAIVLSDHTVSLPDDMEIDLGSTAKGYTGKYLCEFLKERGISSALLDLGGNIQTLGSKPDGTPWRIAIRHPVDTNAFLGTLELTDLAAVTSGGYERFFTGKDGKTYWHILDPATGKPANSDLLSVTVIGKDGLLCDALSTALFVMGLEDAVTYWQKHEDFEVLFVTDTETLYITEGLTDCFTLSDNIAGQNLITLSR